MKREQRRQKSKPTTFWLAVLVEDGIPTTATLGKNSRSALKNLMHDLRETEDFAAYPDNLDEFLEAIRDSESYSIDSFEHSITFNPTIFTRSINLSFAVISQNGLPAYSGHGYSPAEAVRNLITDLREDSDFEELFEDEEGVFDELLNAEEGLLGESEEFGFNTFDLEFRP